MTPTEQAARWLADVDRIFPWSKDQPMILEADALAAIARHLASGDDWDAQDAAWCERVAAITADSARLRDRLARMEGALDEVNEAITQHGLVHMGEGRDEAATAIKALAIAIAPILAALTDGGSNG